MEYLLDELALYFSDSHRCIALSGSGGKTTAMVTLAKHYATRGKRVLISTTTKLLLPKDREYGCDTYFLDDRALSYHPSKGERVFYAHEKHKAVAPPLESLERLVDRYDVVLLEADGAMSKGLKLHEDRDPVIPPFVSGTIAMVALNLIGKPFGENCLGSGLYPHEFSEKTITLATYRKLLEHKDGILKRVQGKTLVLCNQGRHEQTDRYRSLARSVSLSHPIWFGDIRTNQLIYRNPS